MHYEINTPPAVVQDMGTNAPKLHQRAITKLVVELGTLYYHTKEIVLEPLVETMLDEGKSSPTPDILLYDNEQDKSPVIIEVCHSAGQANDLKKIIWLIDEQDYGILEGFIYNYKTRQWLRYGKGDGGIAQPSSWSAVLKLDLADLL